jgi:putative transposase
MDVTEDPTDEGKVYPGVVVDAWSRRVVGWSIADHMRQEPVVDAVLMAIWRRRPPKDQTIAHSDHGSPVHVVGLRVAPSFRRAVGLDGHHRGRVRRRAVRKLFHTLQLELLDEHHWRTRRELPESIFEWLEVWYNASRRHNSIDMLSPIDYETQKVAVPAA